MVVVEYKIEKDVAFCLCCYLFGEQVRCDAFVNKVYKNWKKKEKKLDIIGRAQQCSQSSILEVPEFIQSEAT